MVSKLDLIRLSRSSVGQEEKIAISKVIDDGFLGMGSEVQAFEEDLKAFLNTESEVICVNSGTAAIHLALEALDLKPGDQVLVPTITYVASFQAISATGAIPVACDVSSDRVFIDLEDAQKRVTKRTKAILPVHYASDSQNMVEVMHFAIYNNIRVIEDAAHSFGSTRDNQIVGSSGDVLCFSFDGIKNITCGEGGALVTSDLNIANRVKDSRLLGVSNDSEKRYKNRRSWQFDINHQGWRYHMSNLMAAIGREQLKKIKKFSDTRRNCVKYYIENLNKISSIEILDLDYKNIVPHIFPVKIKIPFRDKLMQSLRKDNIQFGVHYLPNHQLSYYSADYSLPVAENLSKQLISLPLHAELTKEEQDRVITSIRESIG